MEFKDYLKSIASFNNVLSNATVQLNKALCVAKPYQVITIDVKGIRAPIPSSEVNYDREDISHLRTLYTNYKLARRNISKFVVEVNHCRFSTGEKVHSDINRTVSYLTEYLKVMDSWVKANESKLPTHEM